MADVTFHYPPELFNLLIDAIPLLNRSKRDLLLFFKGAGVSTEMLRDLYQRLETDAKGLGKYEIARTVLQRLNEGGERTLRERREVLRRVAEFGNYDACWPDDRLKAKGAVAAVGDIVNQKDSFTRMKMEREEERRRRLTIIEEKDREKEKKTEEIERARRALFALFNDELEAQERGRRLETALYLVFQAFGIAVHEPFHLVGQRGEGIVEQVDGVIELKGEMYFVEVKWYREPVGVQEVSRHFVRLMGRAEARGLLFSASDFTKPAIHETREFLREKVLALCHLEEIVLVLDGAHDLVDFLDQKVRAAIIHKDPYFRPLDARAGQ